MKQYTLAANMHSEYDSDAPLTRERMKWETLLLMGEFKDDYSIPEGAIQECITAMYSIIDNCTIDSWDTYGKYIDAVLLHHYPSLYEGVMATS